MRTKTQPIELEREFGRRLRILREAKGWSQEELADQCNIHRTYVSQLERGLKSPTIRLLWTICHRLAVTPSDYVREIEKAIGESDR
jgi:transcriptional regulator with XRE-family HTH domain